MTAERFNAISAAKPIPVNTPLLNGRERELLIECIETGWISSEGPFVSRFEEEFSRRMGRKFGVAVANGSAALDIAVQALRLGPGDEVIMPSFTIISPAASVVRAGATPVLVDSDPITWNMDVGQIESCITPRTRSILVVHIYGLPTDMDPVLKIAQRHGLALIEDAAEMHGQNYRGRPCGSFGEISVFSFYPNKHVTTGEGGMVVTDDPALAERCRSLRNLCFQPAQRFVHEELGWNYRMTNLQAALGLAQLERLVEFVNRKRAMGRRYTELLADWPAVQLPLVSTDYAENIYWVYGLVLNDSVPMNAAEAMRRLAKVGIGTRPFFWPMHEQPVFRRMALFKDLNLPVSSRMGRRGFYVPSGLGLSVEEIERVSEQVTLILTSGYRS
jgi:perosamine synthetase